jgi:transposase-like protein
MAKEIDNFHKELKKSIDLLNPQIGEAKSILRSLESAKSNLRSVCKHPHWEYEGHDSHKNHYKCKVCGASDSY